MPETLLSAADCFISSAAQSLTAGEYEAAWQGLVYIPGTPAGPDSVRTYLASLPGGLLSVPKGAYFMCLLHKPSGQRYAFVDDSGLFHAFVSDSAISTSFLALAKHMRLGPDDLDPECLVEFFHFGHLFFGKTLFAGIRRIGYNEIVCLDASGKLSTISKGVPDISAPPRTAFDEALRMLAASAVNERVSVDLTGGKDSRMIAVILDFLGADFEVAMSGNPTDRDVIVAERVAKVLGRDLYVYNHDVSDFAASLTDVFYACDGLFDPVKAHRMIAMQKAKAKRGVTVAISGVAGELLSDTWWAHDFPFYCRSTANLSRLFALHIAPTGLSHKYLAPEYRRLSESFLGRYIQSLAPLVRNGNTQTYDSIYYYHKQCDYFGRILTNVRDVLPMVAPFLDRDVAAFGYVLPRTTRFFARYHRKTITRFNLSAARIPTSGPGGMTVSARPRDLPVDFCKYLTNLATRVTTKLGQKMFRKTYFLGNPNNPGFSRDVRQLAADRHVLERLKDHGILSPDVRSEDVRSSYWGNLIGLDLVLEELSSPHQAATADSR
ncbi:MAG: asparagine synthase-related protein [Bryobacteraceae bacterium]